MGRSAASGMLKGLAWGFARAALALGIAVAAAPAAVAGPPAAATSASEPAEQTEALGYSTPLSVLRHFEQSMQRGDTDAAMRCMDLSSIPPGVRGEIGERFALQLALALERLPPMSLEEQPKEDSLTLAATEVGDITLRRRAHAQAVLAGVNAAVVGLLLAALYDPVWTAAIHGPRDFALALTALLALNAWKLPPWAVVLGCGLAGVVLGG